MLPSAFICFLKNCLEQVDGLEGEAVDVAWGMVDSDVVGVFPITSKALLQPDTKTIDMIAVNISNFFISLMKISRLINLWKVY